MKKILHYLDEYLEEILMVIFLIAMTLIMGIQVFSRYVLGMSLSWSEEMHIHKDRPVYTAFSKERKSVLEGTQSNS